MMQNCRFEYLLKNEIYTYGHNLGTHTFEKFILGDFAVWHTPGHTFWSGGRDYSPSCYRVVLKVHNKFDLLAEFYVDEMPWREAKKKAEALVLKHYTACQEIIEATPHGEAASIVIGERTLELIGENDG